MLSDTIPGHIGKWSEIFELRAFGDNFQRLGTATILIEAGGYPDDDNRQYVRELNFKILLYALGQIARADDQHQNTALYHDIPQNTKELFHLLIKNATLQTPVGAIKADIGLNHNNTFSALPILQNALYTVQDIGDLSTYRAYKTINAQGSKIEQNISLGALANFTIHSASIETYCFKDGRLC
jgi:hypothetical protein